MAACRNTVTSWGSFNKLQVHTFGDRSFKRRTRLDVMMPGQLQGCHARLSFRGSLTEENRACSAGMGAERRLGAPPGHAKPGCLVQWRINLLVMCLGSSLLKPVLLDCGDQRVSTMGTASAHPRRRGELMSTVLAAVRSLTRLSTRATLIYSVGRLTW